MSMLSLIYARAIIRGESDFANTLEAFVHPGVKDLYISTKENITVNSTEPGSFLILHEDF